MKNKIFLLLIFTPIIILSQDYSSVLKIVTDPEPTDFIGRFWGITDKGYVDVYIENNELRYTTKINLFSEDHSESIAFKDNAIQIENKWYNLVVFTDSFKEFKRNQIALYRDNKIFVAGVHNNLVPYRYVSFLKIKEEDITSFTPKELKIMRNEIYARHGYIFKKYGEMYRFYKGETWYNPTRQNVKLNDVEKYNTDLIRKIEANKNKVSKILTETEKNTVFNRVVKRNYSINFNIRRAYKCTDTSGLYFIALAENSPKNNIKAVCLKKTKEGLLKQWSMKDNVVQEEKEIWFFTRYFDIKDIDKDGILDPIIIYGTSTPENDNDNSRLKILIYYKNNKIAIRHQNSDMDEGRYTQVDDAFYKLPKSIQYYVDNLINKISRNNHATFNQYPLKK